MAKPAERVTPVADSLPASLARLRKSVAELNQISDRTAAAVREIENFLAECGIGVHVYVKVCDYGHDEPDGAIFLEYRKIGQKFRIAIVWHDAQNPNDEGVKAWSDCSREDKQLTIVKLPELMEAIAAKTDAMVGAAITAETAAKSVLVALTEKEGA
jgi:hypothetical protein